MGWKASSRHAIPPDQEEGWRARRARPQARFRPDEAPWLHCCRRVVRARRLFLRPGRWRRKYKPNSSSGRAAPKAVSRVSPIGGGPCFSARSELRLETKSLSACQEPLLRLSPPRGRESFFKSRRGFLVLRMMARSRRELAKAHMPQLAAERRLGDRDPELLEEPLRQIDQPPAHDAKQGGNRPIFQDLPQGWERALAEEPRSARRCGGQEPVRTFGVETDNPVARDLRPDPADPCRIR